MDARRKAARSRYPAIVGKSRLSAIGFAALFAAATSPASASELRTLIKGGYDFGGDTLQNVQFQDGTTESIKANDGFYIGGGVAFIPDIANFETQLTVAWKYTGVSASNGNIAFTRFPIEALVFYDWDFFRVGGGLTYHLNPKLKRTGVVAGGSVDFSSRVGAIAQVDYRITENVAVGLRYTAITYTTAGRDVRGDGFGVAISGAF